jgi:2'-5' RNA ligase
MVASIWLQPVGDEREILRDLIARVAAEHGTMPFAPHLTVCTIADPTPEAVQEAADYIAACRILPLRVRRIGIQHSPTVPTRAVTVGVGNAPDLREFRERLRSLTGANDLGEPHISLLYSIGSDQQRTDWSGDEQKLRAIVAECEERLAATGFLLNDPVLIAPDGDWSNVASWTVLRRF